MIYEPETLSKFREEAKSLDYMALDSYYAADIMQLVEVCNGIGGQGSAISPALNIIYRRYQSCSSPHDWAYHIGGTEADRAMADAAFYYNLFIRWRVIYGKTRYVNPLALWERHKIRVAFDAVKMFGHRYFNYH